MSCCGKKRASLRQNLAVAPVPRANLAAFLMPSVALEYSGPGRLAVTGPLTGATYLFVRNGARVRVHGADAPSLVSVPGLRAVR
jgi:hypothetical protein